MRGAIAMADRVARTVGVACAALAMASCMDGLPPPEEADRSTLEVGESRTIELRFLRFDVQNFEQTLTREDILALPADVRNRLWLLDLDLRSGPTTPRLLDNALAAIKAIDPETLSPAARNMQALLAMTPETAELEGTSLGELTSLAPLLGLAPEQVLADLLGKDVEDEILSPAVVSETVLEQVISTHPNAQTRLGPRTEESPEGIYPVTPGTLPITLGDAATNFASLSERFGPVSKDGVYHPGFVGENTEARILTDDFRITVRANANALPFKGVDLTNATEASVNSVRSQIDELFDFEDPNWLVIEGLVPGSPVIESMTFRIVEDDAFVLGGRSPIPAGRGSSPGWALAPWSLERVLLGAAQRAFVGHDAEVRYMEPDREEPLFLATVEDGWQEIDVVGGIGAPPPPSYLWDLMLEIAQVRLHDGGIPEGEADVEFTLTDVPAGTDTIIIERTIEENLASDPAALLDVASEIVDNTRGEADFYYVRSRPESTTGEPADWLFFIDEGDIALDDAGDPVRPYGYASPGFFSDPELTTKVSSTEEVEGDAVHEKVRIEPGDTLYAGGPEGEVYQVDVGEKPNDSRVALTVTRLR